MEKKWMLRAVFVLAVCLTRNLTSGHADQASLDSNKTASHSHLPGERKLEGFRKESSEVGSLATFLCTNTKIEWSEMIYIIWKINSKDCTLTVATNDTDHNTCQDGKYINKTGDYSLNIPDFSVKDEGIYVCDVSYRAGGYVETINVTAWSRPLLSSWLEARDGHTFAVCEVQSIPAASIRWETHWNSSLSETDLDATRDASGVFRVTSRLQLPQNDFHKHIICVVTLNRSKWPEIRIHNFRFKDTVKRSSVLLGVFITWPIIKLLITLYIVLRNLGHFRNVYCTSKTATPAEENKTQFHVYEEVELQERVNTIPASSESTYTNLQFDGTILQRH